MDIDDFQISISNLVFSPQSIFSCAQDFPIGSPSRTFPPVSASPWFLILVVALLSTLCPSSTPWNLLDSFLASFLISHQAFHSFPLISF